ncbi:MAG: hypothetical protein ABSG76_17305, partial [Xanthobacteraceae bacterium]
DHLIRYGTIGNGRLFGGYTAPGDPNGADLAPPRFDPGEARGLLEEAGFAKGLELSMIVATQVPPQIEKIISVSLSRVGITVSVRRVSESEFLEQLYLPKFRGGGAPAFDILLLSVPAGTIFHAAMVPMTLLYSQEPNESAIRDQMVDDLYLAGIRTHDPEKARQIWRRLEEYATANHLLFFGYQERAVFGANAQLRFTPRTLMTFWDAYFEPKASEPPGPSN